MGDFTSKYKVTYGDGSSRTESRIDAGKVFDNAIVPIVLLVIAVIALITVLPFIILFPLYLYLKTPFNEVKKIMQLNDDVKDYSDETLTSKGFSNFNELYSSTKIKFFSLITLFLIAIGIVEFSVFQDGMGKLDKFALEMLVTALPLLLLYPIAFAIMTKNRQVLFVILDKKETRSQKFFAWVKKHLKKILLTIFIPLISLAMTLFALKLYIDALYTDGMDKHDVVYTITDNYSDYERTLKETTQSLQEHDFDINDPYSGDSSLYILLSGIDNTLFNSYFQSDDIMWDNEIGYYIYMTQAQYILEDIAKNIRYSSDKNNYKKNYKNIKKSLDIYTELGGDLNIINSSTNIAAIAHINTIEAYYAFKDKGTELDEKYNVEIMLNIIHNLGDYDSGYSKRLANLAKELITTKEMAKELLEKEYNNEYFSKGSNLKRFNQISTLRVIAKMAGVDYKSIK